MVEIDRRVPQNACLRERADQLLERATSKLVTMRDGVEIHVDQRGYKDYENRGDGIDVMLMHGSPSMGGLMIPDRMAFISHRINAISPTRRGYFVSPRKPHRTFEDSANDEADALQNAGTESCYLYAKSGAIGHALSFAARYPERVKAVAIVAGALSTDMMGEEWADGMVKFNADVPEKSDEELYAYISEQARLVSTENTNPLTHQRLQHIPPQVSHLARVDIQNSGYYDERGIYRSPSTWLFFVSLADGMMTLEFFIENGILMYVKLGNQYYYIIMNQMIMRLGSMENDYMSYYQIPV